MVAPFPISVIPPTLDSILLFEALLLLLPLLREGIYIALSVTILPI